MKVLKQLLIVAFTSIINLSIALGVASMISTYYKGLTFIEIVLFVLIMFILIITQSIRQDAFKDNDGVKAPLVWQHDYKDVHNVLGHITLHSVDDGVMGEGYLSETESGEHVKAMLKHMEDKYK